MVERYVFVKLADEHANPASRASIAGHSRQVLAALPGVQSVTVGTPADDESTRAWDLGLVIRFASLDDIEAYRVHPDHRAYVDDYLKPKMVVIKAWNFDVG